MRLRVIAAAAVSLALSAAMPLFAQIRGIHQERLSTWEFSKDGVNWRPVTVPHSYNAEDGHSPSYYRGTATYRCNFKPGDIKHPHYLLFEGAAQAAIVKVNDVQLASASSK